MYLFIYLSVFLTLLFNSNTQTEYPTLTEFVTDSAEVITALDELSLQDKLIAYEKKKTHQIVVLTIESLNGDTIENYAFQVFNRNGIGQKEEDNGILILFSKSDREVRIEVGDGFEPIITDAFASRVIRNIMIPKFKEENYFSGINDGVDEIIKLIDDPVYRDEFTQASEDENKTPLWGKILFGFFIACFFGVFIFVGGNMFVSTYKTLIDVYKGFITGKISLLTFPFLVLTTLLGLLFSLPFIVIPLIFAGVFLRLLYYDVPPNLNLDEIINHPNLTLYFVLVASTVFVLIPFIVAFFSKKPYQALKLSLLKNDKKYISKHISSSGSSSGSSFSSSSSSSFSGGGGSSSGGGASGSW